MRTWSGHAWMLLHFLVVGLLLFWPILAIDPSPHRTSPVIRMPGAVRGHAVPRLLRRHRDDEHHAAGQVLRPRRPLVGHRPPWATRAPLAASPGGSARCPPCWYSSRWSCSGPAAVTVRRAAATAQHAVTGTGSCGPTTPGWGSWRPVMPRHAPERRGSPVVRPPGRASQRGRKATIGRSCASLRRACGDPSKCQPARRLSIGWTIGRRSGWRRS